MLERNAGAVARSTIPFRFPTTENDRDNFSILDRSIEGKRKKSSKYFIVCIYIYSSVNVERVKWREIETRNACPLFKGNLYEKCSNSLRCPGWGRARWLRFEDNRRKVVRRAGNRVLPISSSLFPNHVPLLLLFPRIGPGTQVFPCPGHFRSAANNAAHLSSRISIAKLINPSSVFPGGHPGNFAYPVHRKRAIPSAGRRRPLRFSPPHERGDRRDEEKERKKKERKGRGGEAREKEGRREREKKIRMERKTKRAVARSRGGEWTRGRAGVGRWR